LDNFCKEEEEEEDNIFHTIKRPSKALVENSMRFPVVVERLYPCKSVIALSCLLNQNRQRNTVDIDIDIEIEY
jgi:hypothetical protein